MGVVTESGLYKLIFSSRHPKALAFTEWVTNEVLPASRRDGFYSLEKPLSKSRVHVAARAPSPPIEPRSDLVRIQLSLATRSGF
jgi:prophage antirepressor-like protein